MAPSLSSPYLVAELAKQFHSMEIKYELYKVLLRFEDDLLSKQEVHAPTEQPPTPSSPRAQPLRRSPPSPRVVHH